MSDTPEQDIKPSLRQLLEANPLEPDLLTSLLEKKHMINKIAGAKLSGIDDMTPFHDSVVIGLLTVNNGAHKAAMKTLRDHYGVDMTVVINNAESFIFDKCSQRLIEKRISVEDMDSYEIKRLFFDIFGPRELTKLTQESYAKSWSNWLGVEQTFKGATINNTDKLEVLLNASKAIVDKEYQQLAQKIEQRVYRAQIQEQDDASTKEIVSADSNEFYKASRPLTDKECQALHNQPIKDSAEPTNLLSTTDKKIRKMLKYQFRDTLARAAIRERGYDIKPIRFWLKSDLEETARNKSLFLFRGRQIRVIENAEITDDAEKEADKKKQIKDSLAESFYFTKNPITNVADFEIADGVAPSSYSWGFLRQQSFTHSHNVLATSTSLIEALEHGKKLPNTVPMLQLFAASESVSAGAFANDGKSPEEEQALIQESPGELLISMALTYKNGARWVEEIAVNPRLLDADAKRIVHTCGISGEAHCLQLLKVAISMAKGEIDCFSYDNGFLNSWKQEDGGLKLVERQKTEIYEQPEIPLTHGMDEYKTLRNERIYQPRVEWKDKSIMEESSPSFIEKRKDYFHLAAISDSILTHMSFKEKEFNDAKCSNVVFSGCDFTNVSWKGVSLRNVRFINCKVDVEQLLEQAKYIDKKTRVSLSVLNRIALGKTYPSDQEEQAANVIKSAYKAHIKKTGGFFTATREETKGNIRDKDLNLDTPSENIPPEDK